MGSRLTSNNRRPRYFVHSPFPQHTLADPDRRVPGRFAVNTYALQHALCMTARSLIPLFSGDTFKATVLYKHTFPILLSTPGSRLFSRHCSVIDENDVFQFP
ncbi:hypothetical protein TWF569_001383 [Orbilia oligospora]|uniref:Uncharacterized protein n=1 Tax=Orbilia oligospora TaxID=2813651 RepID=A0A7C8NIQ8_ORBOL|nr:hypothetical protein TWF706_001059 [Orbilia oligospora]KAF3107063.1 hypothetical protein TWF102_000903 [Orbilia oligospora]KAF3117422.1 hypothetical protein TWF103_006166 [Orbilia oligospora]KAF3137363.1 hypothetical protein TWF594_007495 [Orbilia oligospora]KAF3153778.1 hypothetical protein TWF569_001383 [Orbilia oligospora]